MNINFNLKDFLKYLQGYKWVIVIVPTICLAFTYFFVKTLPKTYKSEALISTGVTQQFQQAVVANGQSMDNFKLNQQFGNILEIMRSKRLLNGLSYKLIIHDLKNEAVAFKPYGPLVQKMSKVERQEAINAYTSMLINGAAISISDNEGKLKLYDILNESGYDAQSILKNLLMYRNGESDFIKVEYSSNNSALSAYVVNNLSNDFIDYYLDLGLSSQRKSIAFLDTLVKEKQAELTNKNQELSSSSVKVAEAMVSQKALEINQQRLIDIQTQRAQILRSISAIEGSITEVNRKLSGAGGYIRQDNGGENAMIINLDDQIAAANQQYSNSNFKREFKNKIDSLQKIKLRYITSNSGSTNSTVLKQELINQKIKLETDLASAKSSLSTTERQLNAISMQSGSGDGLLSVRTNNQEVMLKKADLASKEYNDAQALYEQNSIYAKTMPRMTLAEPGLQGPAEPSKNMLYLGFSGISGLLTVLLALFISFILHPKISTAAQLQNVTKQRILGSLNMIADKNKDLRDIWKNTDDIKDYTTYKDLLRSLRFELCEELMGDNKVLGITSLSKSEGKTFLANSLAYAMAMMGKNVLLICDNESDLLSVLTNKSTAQKQKFDNEQKFESFLVRKEIQIEDKITILKTNPANNSLLEVMDGKSLLAGFGILKETFDLIVIDIDSSHDMFKVKEWLMFCDKFISVFEAGNNIKSEDLSFIEYLAKQKNYLGWVLNKTKLAEA